ncbi:MAG: sodium:solute symporter family protein [Oscillospiraceae bacterium]
MWQIWIVVCAYIVTMIIIGINSAKKTKTLTDFVVGSRKAGPWMSAFAYGTTYFSAVIFIGYAGRSGFDYGFWALLIGVCNAVIGTLLAWLVLGNKTRDVTRRLKIKTMPQMFEVRYHSKGLRYFSSIVIFIFMIPYSASVYSGLSYLCEKVLKIDYTVAMIIIACIAAVYLILGGYIASLKADFVQGIIMIFGVIAMVFYVVKSDAVGGLQNAFASVTSIMKENQILPLSSSMTASLIGLCLLTSIGSWGMPQMIQKFYGVADKKGTLWKKHSADDVAYAPCNAADHGSVNRSAQSSYEKSYVYMLCSHNRQGDEKFCRFNSQRYEKCRNDDVFQGF